MSQTGSLHYTLCQIGAEYLKKKKRTKYTTVEIVTSGECADVWGITGVYSYLIEVKTDYRDFLKDKNKFQRTEDGAYYALGNYRYYLCPKGLIKPEELPKGWGLLYFDFVKYVKKPNRQKYIEEIVKPEEIKTTTYLSEVLVLQSIMRREGIKNQIFNYRKNERPI
jgi:hypothetical protein